MLPPQVPLQDTAKYIQSFRLQNLQADTVYVTQVRCQYYKDGQYWSDWSSNVTKRTPEDRESGHHIVVVDVLLSALPKIVLPSSIFVS